MEAMGKVVHGIAPRIITVRDKYIRAIPTLYSEVAVQTRHRFANLAQQLQTYLFVAKELGANLSVGFSQARLADLEFLGEIFRQNRFRSIYVDRGGPEVVIEDVGSRS